MKKALDPYIKRASQQTVKKIKSDIKKQTQMKNMPPKPEPKTQKDAAFNGLKEILNMKKNKAVANEYDSLIYEQERLKEKRRNIDTPNTAFTPKMTNPIEAVIANDPDKLKDMSLDDAKKLAMFTNKSGTNSNISDIKEMIIALNEIKKTDGGNDSLSDKVIGILLDKAFDNNGGQKADSGNDKFMEYMMKQNLQTQEILMNMMEKKNTPAPVEKNDGLVEKLFGVIKNQGELENTFLKERIKQLEINQSQGTDPLNETIRVVDVMKSIGGFIGGQPRTKDGLDHDLNMKTLEFEQTRQLSEDNRRASNMNQITEMVNEGIKSFGKVFSEPITEVAKAKMEQFTDSVKHPEKKTSQRELQQEIDLGDLEEIEDELAEMQEEKIPRRSRFKVSESGK
nr:MAG: hypothetical protein [uncultured archaeon]